MIKTTPFEMVFIIRVIMDQYVIANAAFSKFSGNYMELKKGLPIRPGEMGVLNILSATPGPHTSVMLAELLGVSKPMITAHLTALSEKGYITKEQSEVDKRVYYVHPTEKGDIRKGHTLTCDTSLTNEHFCGKP